MSESQNDGRPESGDSYILVSEPDEALKCLICTEVADDPWQHSKCGKLFCKKCLEVYKKDKPCPSCREEGPQYFEDNRSKREIQSLSVKCSHVEKCDWEGTLGSLREHECGKIVTPCPNGCKGSDDKLTLLSKEDLSTHLEEECPNRDFECEHCGEKGTFVKITQIHDPICQKKIIRCPNTECPESVQRQQVNEHVKSCEYTKIRCKYKSIGCDMKIERKDMAEHEENDNLHLHLGLESAVKMKYYWERALFLLPFLVVVVVLLVLAGPMLLSPNELPSEVHKRIASLQDEVARLKVEKQDMSEVLKNEVAKLKISFYSDVAMLNTSLTKAISRLNMSLQEKVAKNMNDVSRLYSVSLPEDVTRLVNYARLMDSVTFVIPNYQRMKDNKETFLTPSFYLSPDGYHIAIEVHLNGGYTSKRGTHVSIFAHLLRSDTSYEGPIHATVTIELLNQYSDNNHLIIGTVGFKIMEKTPKDFNYRSDSTFFPHSELEQHSNHLMDDSLYLRVSLDTPLAEKVKKPWLKPTKLF